MNGSPKPSIANITAKKTAITATQMILIIPRTSPAIAIPFESSFFIPIAPKMMATRGNKNGTKGIGINHAQHKPIIPKIKAIIPLVFDIFSPFIL